MSGCKPAQTTLGGATKKFTTTTNASRVSVSVVLHAKLLIHHHPQLFSQPTTAKMSDGEVEVASSAYEVLPKEVLAEVGSVKLFSTSIPRNSQFRPQFEMPSTTENTIQGTTLLTYCQLQTAGATKMLRSGTSPSRKTTISNFATTTRATFRLRRTESLGGRRFRA